MPSHLGCSTGPPPWNWRLIPLSFPAMSPRSTWLLTCALIVPGCAIPGPPAAPRPAPRILVVNDDGIDSPGLTTLVRELASVGEVVVCAPDSNRSGASHSSVAFGETLTVIERKIEGASYACSITGTPADATSYGILHLGKEDPFDLVVSGVNRGANVGLVAHYSGTVGAAMEGNYHGIPSVAVSQSSSDRDFVFSARWAAEFVKSLWQQNPQADICWSINVPSTKNPIRGIRAARMGGSYLKIQNWRTVSSSDPSSPDPTKAAAENVRASFARSSKAPLDSDTAAWQEGWITVTPLLFNWTDQQALKSLPTWMPGLFAPTSER